MHDLNHPNILRLITSSTDVVDGIVVEIVLSTTMSTEELPARPHLLNVHSYKTPHFCDFCGDMLWGLVKQGLKCDACGLSFHKRCVHKIPPDDCKSTRGRRKSSEDSTPTRNATKSPPNTSPSFRKESSRETDAGTGEGGGGAGLPGSGSNTQIQVPHTFVSHNYTRPTNCEHCRKLMPLFRQGFQCTDCKFNCHKKCSESVPNNCQGEAKYDVDTSYLESEMSELSVVDEGSSETSSHNGSTDDDDKVPQSPDQDCEKPAADRWRYLLLLIGSANLIC